MNVIPDLGQSAHMGYILTKSQMKTAQFGRAFVRVLVEFFEQQTLTDTKTRCTSSKTQKEIKRRELQSTEKVQGNIKIAQARYKALRASEENLKKVQDTKFSCSMIRKSVDEKNGKRTKPSVHGKCLRKKKTVRMQYKFAAKRISLNFNCQSD